MRLWLLLVLAASCLLAAGDPLFEEASRKMDLIQTGRAARGSVIEFSPAEVNAWARGKAAENVGGVRAVQLELGNGTIKGAALVDLVLLQQSRGEPVNPMLASLVAGERPVKVAVHLESAVAKCTVFLDNVQFSGAELSGSLLNFLIKAFFEPMFPDAMIDRPFALREPIERLTVLPDGLRVFMKK